MQQQALYLFGLPSVYASVAFDSIFGSVLVFAYFWFRGVIDPKRRSLNRPWWDRSPSAALIAIPLGALIDFAKWVGIVQGIFLTLAKWIGFKGKYYFDR
jgi:hypothetical protein